MKAAMSVAKDRRTMIMPKNLHPRSYLGRYVSALACVFALAACEGDLGKATSGTAGTGGATNGTGGGDSTQPCSANNPCPSGLFCFNGVCAFGCASNEDCADDQYCDTEFTQTCQNRETPGCMEDSDCGPEQICVSGLCSTPPESTNCNPDGVLLGNDGCAKDALCIEQPDMEGSYACYTFPPCGADDTCPTGTQGAVCNVDLLPNKERICLIGMCTGVEHCPADWSCAIPQNQVLGLCSAGTAGWPCAKNDDCLSGTCELLAPGDIGFCA